MPQWTATCLAVAIGGGLGAVAREATLTILAGATTHDVPPWLLLLPINLLGCFAMGFTLMVIELRFHREGRSLLRGLPHAAHLHDAQGLFSPDPTVPATEYATFSRRGKLLSGLLITGGLGGFTTISTFTLDLVTSIQQGHILGALLNTALSVVVGVVLVVAGMACGRMCRPIKHTTMLR